MSFWWSKISFMGSNYWLQGDFDYSPTNAYANISWKNNGRGY